MIDAKNIGGGLIALPEDERDFPLGGVFGTLPIEEVPWYDFEIAMPLVIKDQGDTDYCTGFAVTEVSEDHEEVELSPHYQFAKTKEIMGEYESWGADLRAACKSAVKVGSIPREKADEFFAQHHDKKDDRNFVANWENWPDAWDYDAAKYRKKTYFRVDGPYDIFDNIRAAMWQHRAEKRSIVVGAKWRTEWTNAPGGVIPEVYGNYGFGHAFKIYGQKTINAQLHLVAQLSNGKDIGDEGIFYFNRNVVNREFGPFGQYMFKDMEKEEAKYIVENKLKAADNWIMRFIKIMMNFFK